MTDKAGYPVIIIGSGPVGFRCAQELLAADDEVRVEIFSGEQWRPYNRVRLSGFLGGEFEYEDIELPMLEKYGDRFRFKSGQLVTHIHRERQEIQAQDGRCHPYSSLVLATGSRAHIPSIPGVVMMH